MEYFDAGEGVDLDAMTAVPRFGGLLISVLRRTGDRRGREERVGTIRSLWLL